MNTYVEKSKLFDKACENNY